jgi:hypothetical protein
MIGFFEGVTPPVGRIEELKREAHAAALAGEAPEAFAARVKAKLGFMDKITLKAALASDGWFVIFQNDPWAKQHRDWLEKARNHFIT